MKVSDFAPVLAKVSDFAPVLAAFWGLVLLALAGLCGLVYLAVRLVNG